MPEQLVILAADAARDDVRAGVAATGGRVVQVYGSRVWIVDSAVEGGWPGVVRSYAGHVPDDVERAVEDETGRLAISAWNLRHSASFAATRENRVGEGRSWGDEGVEPEG
ncbi:MAG: hypothetical protein ACJ779_09090 [Chloroflexota bacterium]